MANTYTLPGVLLSGVHASRPAASAVAAGTLYAETDTNQAYQSDGVSTWSAWGPSYSGSGMANPLTTTGDMVYSSSGSTPARLAAVATGKVLLSQGTSTAPAWGYPPLHGVMLRRGTTSAFGSGSYAAVTWDTEEWDTDSYHDAVSNTSRITIGTGLGGKYLVTVNAYSAQAGTWAIRKNGSDYTKTAYARTVSDGAGNNLACIAYPMLLSDSDYIECMTNQSSGNLETSANGFGALRIG